MILYGTMLEAEAVLGRTLTWAEAAWFRYSAAMPDSWLLCHNLLIIAIVLLVVPLPLLILEQFAPAVALRYKLQPQVRPPSPAARLRGLRDSRSNIALVVYTYAPLQLMYLVMSKIAGIRTGIPLPSVGEIGAQLVVYALLEDYILYWTHRFMHTTWCYNNFHRVHHELTAPTAGFAAVHGHWVDLTISGMATFVVPIIVPGHVTTNWLWFAIATIGGIEEHSGYEFPFNPTKFIPFYGGAEHHDFHHQVGGRHSNYAPFFTYCDYIYGTHKGYRYQKATIAEKKLAGEDNMEKTGNEQVKQD